MLDVLDGMPLVLPTAQATSLVGNCVKSAVEQEELLGVAEAAEETAVDMDVGMAAMMEECMCVEGFRSRRSLDWKWKRQCERSLP